MLKVANSVISASRITGVLPVVNGGTGVTTSTGTGNTVLSATPTLSGDVNLSTGNLVIGTAGKGIDFSATSQAAGMTSELLADYEEGTWTPVDSSVAALTFTSVTGIYTKVGRLVTCTFGLTFPATASGASVSLGGLPFAAIGSGTPNPSGGSITYTGAAISAAGFAMGGGSVAVDLYVASGAALTNLNFSTFILRAQFTYTAA